MNSRYPCSRYIAMARFLTAKDSPMAAAPNRIKHIPNTILFLHLFSKSMGFSINN
jgi:hypothetical protein